MPAQENKTQSFKAFSKPLNIPPLLEAQISSNGQKVFNLDLKEGKVEFLKGLVTNTYGVNGDFLGPTIKVRKNDSLKINVKNSLREETVMHWHGLKIPGFNDGGPSRAISPNTSWSTEFTINQRASLCWYHPHSHKTTGRQVYMGLAGLIMIEDEESLSLNLPSEYGVDDIPLVLQDRRFDSKAQFVYVQSMHDSMMGVTGDVHMINGVVDPYVEVKPGLIRLRLLNGANARIYSLVFSDNRSFYQIAGDASLLPKPVKLNRLILSPGERAEILVDLSNSRGQSILLGDSLSNRALLKIKVNKDKTEVLKVPSSLTIINEYKDIKNVKEREFSLDMNMMFMGINGKRMSLKRIDEKVVLGDTEIWKIKNSGMHAHPFHIHGCSFKILSRNGKKPYLNEMGLKDTVLLYSHETVEVAVKFEYEASKEYPYMYHCHILEHEDAGMMGQFTVTKV
ncbi:MAG: multicopper oxidase domain-containing protein [Campylobacteraceae bacterium]|nr:multicopper oxidase domain-containing protein [Campylobacteraceae bacterium]